MWFTFILTPVIAWQLGTAIKQHFSPLKHKHSIIYKVEIQEPYAENVLPPQMASTK